MKIQYILALALCFFACKAAQIFKEPIPAQNLKWLTTLDDGLDVKSFYLDKGAVYLNDEMHQGTANIEKALNAFKERTGGVRFLGPIELVEHDSLRYFDLGYYKDKKKQAYAYLIAWNKRSGQWQKEFEVINTFQDKAQREAGAIDRAREQWERLSNSHNHRALIEQSYTTDAIYFNNGKVDQGTEAIVARYSYMSNPKWQINLTPIKVFTVREDLVYEIGQYKSSGIGHYIIVWKKTVEGVWKASIDFNF